MDNKQEVEAAVVAGVFTSYDPMNQRYTCGVCQRQGIGELQAHLNSKEHKNSLIWEAVKDPTPSEYLLQFLPKEVRCAKSNNEVDVTTKATFSYRCKVCEDKKPFFGMAPLIAHITGKDHRKAKNMMSYLATNTSHPGGQQYPAPTPLVHAKPESSQAGHGSPPQQGSSSQPGLYSSPPQQASSSSSQQPLVSYPYPSQPGYEGHIRYPQQTPNHPVAPAQQDYDMYSKLAQQIPGQSSYPQPPPQPVLDPCARPPQPGSPAPHTHHLGQILHPHQPTSGQHYIPGTSSAVNTSGSGALSQMVPDSIVTDRLSAESKEALDAGFVVKSEFGYDCKLCDKSMTGEKPLDQHVDSAKHNKKTQEYKKAQEYMRQHPAHGPYDLPDIGSLKLVNDTQPIISGRQSGPLDQPDGSNFHFPWTVKSRVIPEGSSDMVYRNLSIPRGLVCIFNYHIRGSNIRDGASKDSFNLKQLFSSMGYQVKLYEDRDKQQTMTILNGIQSDPFLEKIDSFVVIILSHGDKDITFTANGGDVMSLDEVRYQFVDSECPNLKSKPKIFLSNFCRGSYKEIHPLQHDYIHVQEKEAPQDMITLHASINNFRALRHQHEGTVFVQALCEVLAESAHDTELGDLYLMIHKVMREKGGTTPEEQRFGFKKFYFNPVHV